MKNSTTEIQAKFIIELMNQGLSFDLAIEKSFDEVNEFLNDMNKSEFFKTIVFEKSKNIINGR